MPSGRGDHGDSGSTFVERARREQIVRATIDTLAAAGYARTSFSRIAERIGISPGLISYHFGSKQELLQTVVDTVAGEIDAAASTHVEGVDSYGEALRGVVESQVRYYGTHRQEVLALGAVLAAGDDRDTREPAGAALRAQGVRELIEFLDEGQADGEFRSFDSRTVAGALWAALEAVPRRMFTEHDLQLDLVAHELGELFVRATAPDTPPGGRPDDRSTQ